MLPVCHLKYHEDNKSSVEPSVENLVDQEATSIMEIFAKSHAKVMMNKFTDGGEVFISGGKFQSAPKKGTVPAEYTTLNLKDNTDASIEVTGEEFVNFNPGAITFEPGVTSFEKAGYKAILKQYSTTDYIVVAE